MNQIQVYQKERYKLTLIDAEVYRYNPEVKRDQSEADNTVYWILIRIYGAKYFEGPKID